MRRLLPRRLLLALIALLAVAAAPAAPAAQAAQADGPPLTKTVLYHGAQAWPSSSAYGRWLRQFKVPAPPGYVDLSVGACPVYDSGCMDWAGDHATVHLAPDGRDLRTFAHELGHVFDMYVLSTTGYRPRFAALLGEDWLTPRNEEQFAEAYALCAFNRRLPATIKTGYGLVDTPALHTQICALIRAADSAWLAQADHPYGQTAPAGLGG